MIDYQVIPSNLTFDHLNCHSKIEKKKHINLFTKNFCQWEKGYRFIATCHTSLNICINVAPLGSDSCLFGLMEAILQSRKTLIISFLSFHATKCHLLNFMNWCCVLWLSNSSYTIPRIGYIIYYNKCKLPRLKTLFIYFSIVKTTWSVQVCFSPFFPSRVFF
jgi:hypothetical protein